MAGSGPPSVDDLLKGFRDGTSKKYKIDIEKGRESPEKRGLTMLVEFGQQ
jgi:hypothetical protein